MIRHETGSVPSLIVEAAAVTLKNARALWETGRSFLDGNEKIIDLSAVIEVDSAALTVLLEWQRENLILAREKNKAQEDAQTGKLRISGAPANLVSLAELYSLQDLLTA